MTTPERPPETPQLTPPPASGVIQLFSDDWLEASQIRSFLQFAGFSVELLRGRGKSVAMLESQAAVSAIIDVTIGRADALDALRRMRAAGWQTPVMLLSPVTELSSQVEAFDAGADQYLAKPFASQELIARARAMARRGAVLRASMLRIGDLVLNSLTRQATRGGRSISLTQREYDLLLHFMSSPGRICDRASILHRVWGYHSDPGTNIVDVYVRKLRDKIDAGQTQKLIQSVRGVGYVMRCP